MFLLGFFSTFAFWAPFHTKSPVYHGHYWSVVCLQYYLKICNVMLLWLHLLAEITEYDQQCTALISTATTNNTVNWEYGYDPGLHQATRTHTEASGHWTIFKQNGLQVKWQSSILRWSSWQISLILNNHVLKWGQIRFYLCKLCLWINCWITATSCSLHEYCSTVHHLFCHLFESYASVTISSEQQAPYSYHITILMEHIRKALVGFEVFLRGVKQEANSKLNIWDASLLAVRLPLNPYSNRLFCI